jgi:hypothetical protein
VFEDLTVVAWPRSVFAEQLIHIALGVFDLQLDRWRPWIQQ